MSALEDLPGADLDLVVDDNAWPGAISDDGRTVVGVGSGTDGRRLGRWVDSQIEVLWNRRLDWSMSFHVLSDGRINSVSMGGQNRHTGESYGGAMVWRAGLGITPFEHYAAFHHGLDLGLNAGAGLMLTTMTPDGWHFGV